MPNFNRIRGGYIAKRRGQFFEQTIINTARRQSIEVLDIPDGCEQKSQSIIIRVPTPFDFVIAKRTRLAAFFDAKTIETKGFPYNKIDLRQVENLRAMAYCGFPSGYIVHHRETERVVFYEVGTLIMCPPRTSLTGGIDLGHISDFDLNKVLELTR